MRLIPQAEIGLRLRECAVTNRTTDKEGFIETGNVLSAVDMKAGRPHERDIFISVAAAKEMARLVGWHPPEEIAEIREAFDSQTAKIAELQDYVDKLEVYKALEEELTEVAV